MTAKTLFEKVWETHLVRPQTPETPAVLYIDLHLVHEVTSPQAFTLLREYLKAGIDCILDANMGRAFAWEYLAELRSQLSSPRETVFLFEADESIRRERVQRRFESGDRRSFERMDNHGLAEMRAVHAALQHENLQRIDASGNPDQVLRAILEFIGSRGLSGQNVKSARP